jgi:hypothetical protein
MVNTSHMENESSGGKKKSPEIKQVLWRSYIAKVPVQYLHVMMDDLKSFQFIVRRINAHTEVKACIPEDGAWLMGT